MNRERKPLFSQTPYGNLCRVAYYAVWRHVERYGKALALEPARDAVQDAIVDAWQQYGTVESALQALQQDTEARRHYCRAAVNAYNRYVYRDTQAESLHAIMDDRDDRDGAEYVQWRFGQPDRAIEQVEHQEHLRAVLSSQEYAVWQALLAGYTQAEAAARLGICRRTVIRTVQKIREKAVAGVMWV